LLSRAKLGIEIGDTMFVGNGDITGQPLPHLIVVSGRVTQDDHDHSA
jgi:hypothetical protein